MVVPQSTMRAGSWTQFRSFSKSLAQLERFTRESLRNRISKQNLKDVVKQNVHYPGPYKPPLPVDVILVRPSKDLWKALGFTVAVGVGSFTVAYVSKFEQIGPLQKPDKQKFTWEDLTAGEKATLYLIGANALVFLMWKRKPLKPFMRRYFCSSFASKSLCYPMLLSAFSQHGLLHIVSNMYVLYFFADLAIDKFLGPGQFWAFYCTAGVVSSLMSLVHRAAIRSKTRSLGASGAIYTLVSYVCMKIPDEPFPMPVFPGYDVSARSAFIGMIVSDIIGLALFRKFLNIDHAGHLGGAVFGVFYALIGEQFMGKHFGGFMEDVYIWLTKKDRTS